MKLVLGKELLERVVTEVEKTIAEQPTMPSCQVSSGTVEFDCGEETSAKEPKMSKFSVDDLLSDRIVPLVKY